MITDPNTLRQFRPATDAELAKLAGKPKVKVAPVVEIKREGWKVDIQNIARIALLQIKESRGYRSLSRER